MEVRKLSRHATAVFRTRTMGHCADEERRGSVIEHLIAQDEPKLFRSLIDPWKIDAQNKGSPQTSRVLCSTSQHHEMPPERHRTTNNPQGRQKSCSECAKAKRRCDLRQPSCLRCTRQDLACLYPPPPATDVIIGNTTESIMTPIAKASTETPGLSDASTPLDALAGDNDACPFAIPFLSNHNLEIMDFDFSHELGVVPVPQSLEEELNGQAEGDMSLADSNYLPGKLYSASHISPHAQARVEYSIDQLKASPEMMVKENQTPWCHPHLYEVYMPRSLQDAHAACALYISRNEVNATFVARHITDHVKELLDTPVPTNSIEVLARAQALVLYQAMLVSSGDLRYYAQVNGLIRHLEESGTALTDLVAQEVDPLCAIPLYPSNAARAAWRSFIFREAARRSLVVVYHLLAMCNLLRGHLQTCNAHLALGNKITLSAHLWNATSAFDFAVAWNEKKHHLVQSLDFTDVLQIATPDEIDVFGRMIMTALMGIDDVKGWFHTRGGTF
ncbi:hypothetical protein K504DRAFT_499902 [Pleomassaria siparia CBS 279.74]|uniref:Zn(2)-C6 fungal-type domain-containing protein n=1 Tax=Pleomassaria siparia CBS 279.74 TaxID=1314801 RepID=A0A6G1KJ20_9PLEO|nr:hypothetical protein K504DRAFT_499902 [Pleomassaria siparia CBS 279.74]